MKPGVDCFIVCSEASIIGKITFRAVERLHNEINNVKVNEECPKIH